MKWNRRRTDSRHTASHLRGLHEWAAVLGILVGEVGRDGRVVRGFLYTILARIARRVGVRRRYIVAAYDSLLRALDAIQSDSEVGIHELA